MPPSPVKIVRERIQTEPFQRPSLTQVGASLLKGTTMGDVAAALEDPAVHADK